MSLNCLVLSLYDSGLLGQIWEVRRPPLSPCLTLRTHPVEDEDPQGGEPRSRETSSLYCHPPESSEVKTSFTTLLFEESRIWGQHPVGCNSALDLWGGPAANPPPCVLLSFPKWGFGASSIFLAEHLHQRSRDRTRVDIRDLCSPTAWPADSCPGRLMKQA